MSRFGEVGIVGLGVVLYRIDYAGVKDFTSFDECVIFAMTAIGSLRRVLQMRCADRGNLS